MERQKAARVVRQRSGGRVKRGSVNGDIRRHINPHFFCTVKADADRIDGFGGAELESNGWVRIMPADPLIRRPIAQVGLSVVRAHDAVGQLLSRIVKIVVSAELRLALSRRGRVGDRDNGRLRLSRQSR